MENMIEVPPYFINGAHRISVNIIGAGGTGSLILTKIARLHNALVHLGHPGFFVTLVDYDVVEEFNVGRQMFTTSDIGHFKSDVLISKVNNSFGFDWECSRNSFNENHALANIVVSAVDNIQTRKEIIAAFYKKGRVYLHDLEKKYFLLDCGNARDYGQIILSDFKEKLKSIWDIAPDWTEQDTEEKQGPGCSYMDKLKEQDLFVNDWVSMYAVNIIKDLMFNKVIDYQGVFFNTADMVAAKIKVSYGAQDKEKV